MIAQASGLAVARAPGALRVPVRDAPAAINPATGLYAGYLAQFDEAIILLQMLATTPDCIEHFYGWQPRSYREYLQSSGIVDHTTALAAYEAADPALRRRLEALVAAMIELLSATREAMQAGAPSPAIGMVANRAAIWLGSLVTQAGAVIDGSDPGAEIIAELDVLVEH